MSEAIDVGICWSATVIHSAVLTVSSEPSKPRFPLKRLEAQTCADRAGGALTTRAAWCNGPEGVDSSGLVSLTHPVLLMVHTGAIPFQSGGTVANAVAESRTRPTTPP